MSRHDSCQVSLRHIQLDNRCCMVARTRHLHRLPAAVDARDVLPQVPELSAGQQQPLYLLGVMLIHLITMA